MKFFVYVFSLYILALSIMPCNDAYYGHRLDKSDAAYSQSHSKADKNDTCPPFCTCSCCCTSVNPEIKSIQICFEKIPTVSVVKFSRRDVNVFSNYHGNIWQPPKINA